jgi:hypothetical protein
MKFAPAAVLLTFMLAIVAQPLRAADKLAEPEAAAVAESRKQIAEIYQTEYAAAKTPVQKLALAKKLLATSAETKNDPVAKFALAAVATKMACQAGDVQFAMQTLDKVAADFEINRGQQTLEILKAAADTPKTDPQVFVYCRTVESAIAPLLKIDDYDDALKIVDLALTSAKRSKNPEFIEEWTRRRKELAFKGQAFSKIGAALETLRDKPADPAANGAVGRFRGFFQEQWREAIPMLAIGDDHALATIAENDLRMPEDAPAQEALATHWSTWALTQPEPTRQAALRRALYWYHKAAAKLDGLAKVRVEKRVTDLSKTVSPFRPGQWVELLDAVDVDRHSLSGKWHREGVAISVTPGPAAKLALPVDLSGTYELRLWITDFSKEMGVCLPHEEHPCEIALNCWNGGASGIHTIDGRGGDVNPSRADGFPSDPAKLSAITIRMDRRAGAAAIDVLVDGAKYISWRGREASLNSDDKEHRQRLFIVSKNASLTVLSAQLRLVDGRAAFME